MRRFWQTQFQLFTKLCVFVHSVPRRDYGVSHSFCTQYGKSESHLTCRRGDRVGRNLGAENERPPNPNQP